MKQNVFRVAFVSLRERACTDPTSDPQGGATFLNVSVSNQQRKEGGRFSSSAQTIMDASQLVPENKQEVFQRRLPNPLGRWETPVLFLIGISTILLWLLQGVGYHAPWFTHISPWVALGVGFLSFSLLIVYVLGMLVSKRREHPASPIASSGQANAASESFPEDKTFQQALQEVYQRLTKARSVEIQKRLERVMGQTIESITADSGSAVEGKADLPPAPVATKGPTHPGRMRRTRATYYKRAS